MNKEEIIAILKKHSKSFHVTKTLILTKDEYGQVAEDILKYHNKSL